MGNNVIIFHNLCDKQHYLLFVLDQKTLPSYAPLLTEAQIISENIQ